MKSHWEVLAAADFFTAEETTWYGIVTFYVFFVIDLATRRVHIAGVTPNPFNFLSGKALLTGFRTANHPQSL